MPRTYLRAPDHLGDGILALPAVAAVCAAGPTRIVGPAWVPEVYGHLPVAPVPDPELAVLLKPAFRAAWEARRVPRRVGLPTDHRRLLLTDPVEPVGGHRCQEFLAIVRTAGFAASGLPTLPTSGVRPPDLPARAVLLFPFSASGPTVDWGGYSTLADTLVRHGFGPVFAGGPGQEPALRQVGRGHRVLPTLPLRGLAAAAVAAEAVVGNDSGLTHLAAAARRGAGVPVERVHVVCGSTDPQQTAAPGATPHQVGASLDCWPCYKKRCRVGTPCLDLPAAAVAAAVVAA